jgi:predicted exporter
MNTDKPKVSRGALFLFTLFLFSMLVTLAGLILTFCGVVIKLNLFWVITLILLLLYGFGYLLFIGKKIDANSRRKTIENKH